MFTQKMYKALRRDNQGKENIITDLLNEIDRLNKELHPVCNCERCTGINDYCLESEDDNPSFSMH